MSPAAGSRRLVSVAFALLVLSAGLSRSRMAAEGVRELPPLPSAPSALHADRGGHLYAALLPHVLTVNVKADESGWVPLDLQNVLDLTTNAEGRVFARCDLGHSHVFFELQGGAAEVIQECSPVSCDAWYVDSTDRIWLQSEEELVIAPAVGEPQVVKRRAGRFTFRLRKPCEWRPGHVFLYYGTQAVWADPGSVQLEDPPPFAADGTGNGPLRIGDHCLVSGGADNQGMGSYLIDALSPGAASKRLGLGWDWFYGVASAPDGRALVLGQTDRNPQFTLFWYAPDGRSAVRLKGAEDVIRAASDKRALSNADVVFNRQGDAFVALQNGMLGILAADTAHVVTPIDGLPVERLTDVAILGDGLVMADADGRVVLWDTQTPLTPLSEDEFDAQDEWTLAGPCCLDAAGNMWAFLADFPGYLSCYDGKGWKHVPIELGNRSPRYMTADDLGNLQISFQDYPSGGCLYANGEFTFWWDGPTKPWRESLRMGATRFSDGSAFRSQHWTDGSGKGLFYGGRHIWDGRVDVDYYDLPPYHYWWVEPDQGWYRVSGGTAMVCLNGRWRAVDLASRRFILGSNGLRLADGMPAASGEGGHVPVEFRNGRAYVVSPQATAPGRRMRRDALFEPEVGPDVVLRTGPDGTGWMGCDRYVLGCFPVSARASKVYEAGYGRFFLVWEERQEILRVHRPRDLGITAELTKVDDAWSASCKITADPPPDEPRVVVVVNGMVEGPPADPKDVRISVSSMRTRHVALYAVDRLGDICSEPFTFDAPSAGSGSDFAPPVQDRPHPPWHVMPTKLGSRIRGGDPLLIGRSLATDQDGNVWMASSDAGVLLRCQPATGTWETVAVPETLELANSPDGRAWGFGSTRRDSLQRSLYSLSRAGVEHVADVYNDRRHGKPLAAWDGEGNLWACGLRWVGRWDGRAWREWERPVGWSANLRTGPGDRAVVLCEGGFLAYADGELSEFRTYPDNWVFSSGSHLLGDHYLVGDCQRREGRDAAGWRTGIYDMDTGELDVRSLSTSALIRPDGRGNLYVWEPRKEEFFLLQGQDAHRLELPYCAPPARDYFVGEETFLCTRDGKLVYRASPQSIAVWTKTDGTKEYGVQQGIAEGTSWAIAEDASGCVWIIRDSQLLCFDPEGRAETSQASAEDEK